jgi:anti-sigma regulatory factor (Ser/Thr protein kinase)
MGGMLVRQEPASVSTVRRELALELDMWGVPSDVIDDATLVLSEILGNAIRHCAPVDREDLDVSWVVLGDVVCITVEDRCDRLPILRIAAPDAPSGRGLAIVEALCREWGFDRTPRGKRVWARIAIP